MTVSELITRLEALQDLMVSTDGQEAGELKMIVECLHLMASMPSGGLADCLRTLSDVYEFYADTPPPHDHEHMSVQA